MTDSNSIQVLHTYLLSIVKLVNPLNITESPGLNVTICMRKDNDICFGRNNKAGLIKLFNNQSQLQMTPPLDFIL